VDDIYLGKSENIRKWLDKPLSTFSDHEVSLLLLGLQKLAEYRRQAALWVYHEMQADAIPHFRHFLKSCKELTKSQTWKDFVDPEFFTLIEEAKERNIRWNTNFTLAEEIDISLRGSFEREIAGSLKDAIQAHGPITAQNVCSAAKRVIGSIKNFNRKTRNASKNVRF